MNVKKITSLTLVALASLSLAGCSLSGNVESLRPYAPSDGVQVDAQSLKARNVLLIQGESGRAVLIGSFVNSSQEDLVGSVQTKDSAGQDIRVEFAVKAGTKFDIGYNGTEPITFQLDGNPGQVHDVAVSGGGDPFVLNVPVMDGSLLEYREYAESLN
ncbi:MAG: hypothetical protein K9G07_00350 [Aquiluna sp.]|nr:hypothetical protein [Aquiluna sp.]